MQEYPEDGAASSDSQMLLSFEEFKQIMDEWDVIPIFVNPHKFAQHKQVGHSTMFHAVERSAGATAAVLLDSCSICQQYCSTCHDERVLFASAEAALRKPSSLGIIWRHQKLVVLLCNC